MDVGVKFFAWGGGNNHKFFVAHSLTQIPQGFGSSIKLSHIGLRNYFFHKGGRGLCEFKSVKTKFMMQFTSHDFKMSYASNFAPPFNNKVLANTIQISNMTTRCYCKPLRWHADASLQSLQIKSTTSLTPQNQMEAIKASCIMCTT